MSDQEILTKAILKAIAGGWQPVPSWRVFTFHQVVEFYTVKDNLLYELFTYNHDFAKALWGEDESEKPVLSPVIGSYHKREIKPHEQLRYMNVKNWQYHLQQMVIAYDPIKYLGENI